MTGSKSISSFITKLLKVNNKNRMNRCITERQIDEVIDNCAEILLSQPIMLEIEPPLKLCGDIHGQYRDMLRIFNIGEDESGYPPETRYLFLGDYVDRGSQQLEVICLLMGYKVQHPLDFYFVRGNHECSEINKVYGFYDDCKRRYSTKLYNSFQHMFDCLPLCALVGTRIFCMHGGLSPQLTDWRQLDDSQIKRPFEPKEECLETDLLWADPAKHLSGWAKNCRGTSYVFGADVVKNFCKAMDIDLIARAHQVVEDGFEFFADRHLVTIFSAPMYCGECDNSGGIMVIDENLTCSFETLKPLPKTRIRVRKSRRSSL